MSTPHISLAMLARSAYRPAEKPGPANDARFQPEPERQTVAATPAVRVELSAAARSALLALQEVAAPAPAASAWPNRPPSAPPVPAEPPGSRLNLSV